MGTDSRKIFSQNVFNVVSEKSDDCMNVQVYRCPVSICHIVSTHIDLNNINVTLYLFMSIDHPSTFQYILANIFFVHTGLHSR